MRATARAHALVLRFDRHGSNCRNPKGHRHAATAAGAKAFLDELRSLVQVIILSDTFEQFAAPLLRQLELADAFVPPAGRGKRPHRGLPSCASRPEEESRRRVQVAELPRHFRRRFLQRHAMLLEANVGFLIHAPEKVKKEFPQFKAVDSHAELLKLIKAHVRVERSDLTRLNLRP
jgi:phosphoserine / homoserine phosphotransferase